MMKQKVVPYVLAPGVFSGLRAAGKKIVHCHGTFDLVHPGHIVHFEEAKALGDVLVVTVTAEAHVNKGPGRPYFNDEMRAKWLAALEVVDYVVLVPFPAAVEAIECVRADVYCKGKEYLDTSSDVTGNIHGDLDAVRRCGGTVAYVGSVVFSSSRLLNNHFETRVPAVRSFCRRVANICPPQEFRETVEGFSKLRVVIIGDIIFDRYTTLKVQGLTSKNRILSGRFLEEETQAGWALAVFRHVREFTPHVKLVSLVGTEPWVEGALAKFTIPSEELVTRSGEFTTVVKQRFVEPRGASSELSKLFSVNYVDADPPGEALQDQLVDRIAGVIEDCDLVIAMDFGHGMFEDKVRDFVQRRAPFLAINCQTNSNNHGFNILNRRFHRADAFSLDQTEMTLAVGRRRFDFARELEALSAQLHSRYGWLTRGVTETLGYQSGVDMASCLPFERNAVDTLGAGDAFCSVAFLAAARGLNIDVATFMGQLAGAQAVKIVGNAEPIRKASFLKGAASMLAF